MQVTIELTEEQVALLYFDEFEGARADSLVKCIGWMLGERIGRVKREWPAQPLDRVLAGARESGWAKGGLARDADSMDAPALLAACKLAEIWLCNCMPVSDAMAKEHPLPLPVIRAAIAKAEGRAA